MYCVRGAFVLLAIVFAVPAVNAQKAQKACDRDLKSAPNVTLKTPLGTSQGMVCLDDGDSFSIGPAWVRLASIDAPEIPRNCLKQRDPMPVRCKAPVEALLQLSDLLHEGAACEATQKDSRNRWLVACTTPSGKDVAAEMVKKGWACADTRYDKRQRYLQDELESRKDRVGLWAPDVRRRVANFPSAMCLHNRD